MENEENAELDKEEVDLVVSGKQRAGSRASSQYSHFREPRVQLMTDSECSSPRKGRFSSTQEGKQEDSVAMEKLLDINDASLCDMMDSMAETPSASVSSKIIKEEQMKERENEQPRSLPEETESPQHSKNPRSFAKSMIEVSKPAAGHAELTCEESLQGRFHERSAEGELQATRSAISQHRASSKDAEEKKSRAFGKTNSEYHTSNKHLKPSLQKGKPLSQSSHSQSKYKPTASKPSINNMNVSSKSKQQPVAQGSSSLGRANGPTTKTAQGAPQAFRSSKENKREDKNSKPKSLVNNLMNQKPALKERDQARNGANRDKSDQNYQKPAKMIRNLQINTDMQKLRSSSSPKPGITVDKEEQAQLELSSLDTACMIPANGSFAEAGGEESKDEPKSPVTAVINYDLKPCDSNQIINGQNAVNQNIFYEADDSSQNNNKIKVVIRARPFNERESSDPNKKTCISIENGTLLELDRGNGDAKKFSFDFVGHEKIDQLSFFNHIAKPIADSCLQGYNGTIFAYGQTGAGKTYTIQGPQGPMLDVEADPECASPGANADLANDQGRGIMQRSFEYIFQCIEAEQSIIDKKGNGSALQFLVKCSFLEIYNEQIMDLLEPSSVNLNIREDINKGVYVEGLQEEAVGCQQDMMQLISKGSKNRHVGATSMNRQSSRSHSVLTTIIESKSRSATGVWNVKQSRFHIIDLAGSERQKLAGTVGDRLKEAGMINRSLSALGNVINSLVDISEGKNRFVAYRDSKLTFILRDSLGGNSKTVIIANISPSHLHINETLSTLKFAQRAKLIRNKAVINEDSSGTLLLLKNEIKKLKKDLTDQVKQVSLLQSENRQLASQSVAIEQNELQSLANQSRICRICHKNLMPSDEVDELMDENINFLVTDSDRSNSDKNNLKLDKRADSDLSCRRQRFSNLSGSGTSLESLVKIAQLQDRITAAEKILNSKLLAYTTNMESIQNLEQQNRKLSQSVELYESENRRLKELFDLKEMKIQQLEDQHSIIHEEDVIQLQSEISYLKAIINEQVDKQISPKLLKLEAENEDLRKLKEDHIPSLASLSSQLQEQSKLIEQLNDYTNTKCSLQSVQQMQQQNLSLQTEKDMLNTKNIESQEQLEELQQQYDHLLEQNLKMEETAQQQTRDHGRALVQIQALTQQNLKLEQDRDAKDELEKTLQQLHQIEKDHSCSQIIIEQMKLETKAKDEQLEENQLAIEQIKEDLGLKDGLLQDLSRKMADLEVEIRDKEEQLLSEIEQGKQEKISVAAQIEQLHRSNLLQIADYEHQLEDLQRGKEETLKQQEELKSNTQRKIFETAQEIEELQNQKKDLEKSLEAGSASNSQLQMSLLGSQELISDLERSLACQQSDLSDSERSKVEQNGRFEAERSELLLKIKGMDSKIKESIKTLSDLTSTNKQQLEDNGSLRNANTELLAQMEQLNSCIASLEHDKSRLCHQLEASSSQSSALEQEIQDLRAQLQSLRKHILDQQDVIDLSKDQIKQARDGAKSTMEHQVNMQKDLVQQKVLEVQKQQLRMEGLKARLEELQQDVENRDTQISEMGQAIKQQEASSKEAQKEYETSRDRLVSEVGQLKEVVKHHQDETQRLKASEAELNQAVQRSEEVISSLTAELQAHKAIAEDQDSQIQLLNENRDQLASQLKTEISNLQNKMTSLQFSNSELENLKVKLNEDNKEKQATIETLKSHNQQLQDDKSHLQHQHDEQVSQLQEDIRNKEKENAANQQVLKLMEEQGEASQKERAAITQEYEEARESWQHESKRQVDELEAVQKEFQEAQESWTADAVRIMQEKGALEAEIYAIKQTMGEEVAKAEENSKAQDEEYQVNMKMLKAEIESHIRERSTMQEQSDEAASALREQLEIESVSKAALIEQLEATKTKLAVEALAFQQQNDTLKYSHEQFLAELTRERQAELDGQKDEMRILEERAAEQARDLQEAKDSQAKLKSANSEMVLLLEDLEARLAHLESCGQQKEHSIMELQIQRKQLEILNQDTTAEKERSVEQLAEVCQSLEIEKTRRSEEKAEFLQSISELKVGHAEQAKRHRMEIESLQVEKEQLIAQAEKEGTTARNQQLAKDQKFASLNDQYTKMKKEEAEHLIIAKSLEQLKLTCYDKIETIKSSDSNNITSVLLQIQEIDNELERKGCESTEINVLVSQVAFELTKLYEKQFQDLKSKALVLQKDIKTIGEKYEKSKSEIKQLKQQNEKDTQKFKTMMENEILKHESYQKDKSQAQKALSDKVIRDQEVQLEQKESTIKDSLTRQSQLHSELERYKSLLAEAESLLQEVNKRHQVTQRELDILTIEHERSLKTNQKMANELENERHRYIEQQTYMQDNVDEQEAKFEKVQEQVNILAQSSKQAKREKEEIWSQSQQLLEKLNDLTTNDQKQKQELQSLKLTIQKRESEMREVVKTLKQFSEEKKAIERENERLRGDVDLLSKGGNNPSYKIQLHMKIKEENNRLKEENQKILAELQRRDQAPKKSEKKLIESIATHIGSLPALDSVLKGNRIKIGDEKKMLEFLSAVENLICQTPTPAGSSQMMMPPRTPVGAGNQVFTANQILARNIKNIQIQHFSGSSHQDNQEIIPDISTYTDLQGIPHHQSNSIANQHRANSYFAHESEFTDELTRQLKEQDAKSRQGGQDIHKRKSTTGMVERKGAGVNARTTVEDCKAAIKNAAAADSGFVALKAPQHGSSSREDLRSFTHLESTNSIDEHTKSQYATFCSGNLPGAQQTLRTQNEYGTTSMQGSPPLVLNSYSSIYKQRDQSKNSRHSKSSARGSHDRIQSSEKYKNLEQIKASLPSQRQLIHSFQQQQRQVSNPAILSRQKGASSNSQLPESVVSGGGTTGSVLHRSSSGSSLGGATANKHKQFKQNQLKQGKSIARGASRQQQPTQALGPPAER